MNIPRFNFPARLNANLGLFLSLTIAFGCAGCGSLSHQAGTGRSARHADNVYRAFPALPRTVQRVVVLPVASDSAQAAMLEGIETLEPLLIAELVKTRKFEVIRATPRDTRMLTGASHWTGAEKLPARLPAAFHSQYGCDAILFCELTAFRPYPPLAVGWRMKLVDVRTLDILWAGDEVFDAGRPAVLKNAIQYHCREQNTGNGTWAMERSPGRFGQYATAQMLATLPAR